MIDERILEKTVYTQTGDSCYFFSYYYALFYFNYFAHPLFVFRPHHVFEQFISFLAYKGVFGVDDMRSRLEEYRKSKDKVVLSSFENSMHGLFFQYANDPPGKLSGYQVLAEFDQWLIETNNKIRPRNIDLVRTVRCCQLGSSDMPALDDIYQSISDQHTLILIGYPSTGIHSVVIFETADKSRILFKDSNYQGIVSDITSVPIQEKESSSVSPFLTDIRFAGLGQVAKTILSNNNCIGEYMIFKKKIK